MMRVLTVRQPFADLIMAGVKDVENRTRPFPSTVGGWMTCPYCPVRWPVGSGAPDGVVHRAAQWDGQWPVRIGIHAAKKVDFSNPAWQGWRNRDVAQDSDRLGVLLGTVTVTGCHHAEDCVPPMPWEEHCSRWAEPDVWHWTLTDPQPMRDPIPAKGALGLWRPDEQLAAQLEQAVAHA